MKVDVVALAKKNIGLGYEWRFNSKTGLEAEILYEHYKIPYDNIFNGNRINYYIERKADSMRVGYHTLSNVPTWRYISEARRLPDVPEHIPKNTIHAKLAYRFSYQNPQSNWRLVLQPGLTYTQHLYFQVYDTLATEKNIIDVFETGEYPYIIRVTQQTRYMQETRVIRQKMAKIIGFSYDIALSYTPRNRVVLEGGIGGGLSYPSPYKHNRPRLIKEAYTRATLKLGYIFW